MQPPLSNILTVIAAPHWGGLHVVVERTSPFYRDNGFQRLVMLPASTPDTVRRLEAAQCTVIPAEFGRIRKTINPIVHLKFLWRFFGDVRKIVGTIRERDVCIVEVAGLLNLQPVVAAKWCNVPLVWQMHSVLAPRSLRRILGSFARRAAAVVMTSGESMAIRHGGLVGAGAPVIPFCAPIDLERFSRKAEVRARVRKDLGYLKTDIVVGTLGNRGWQKRHEWIVHIADRMRASGLLFAIAGSGVDSNADYYERKVVRQIAHLGLGDSIQVIDQRHCAEELMNAFDIFILPSIAEGASLVTAEAMAAELPVVASDVGSLPDIVHQGVNGFLCPAEALQPFCDALDRLRDPDVRIKMGQASRQIAMAQLGAEFCAQAHFKAYGIARKAI